MILLIITSELNRVFSIKYPIEEYYFKLFPLPILGSYNTILRIFHPEQTHIYNPLNFPSDKIIKNNFANIQSEGINIYNNQKKLMNFGELQEDIGKGIDEEYGKWKVFPIKFYGKINEEALKLCPETCKTIEKCSDIQIAMFSILEPGKHIKPHKGPSNMFIRYQLGIKIPKNKKNCYIKVNNIKYYWTEGESLIFDDTYIHEVVNNTNEPRIVLFIDIMRPTKSIFTNINNLLLKYSNCTKFIKETNDNIEKKYSKK